MEPLGISITITGLSDSQINHKAGQLIHQEICTQVGLLTSQSDPVPDQVSVEVLIEPVSAKPSPDRRRSFTMPTTASEAMCQSCFDQADETAFITIEVSEDTITLDANLAAQIVELARSLDPKL